MALLVGYLTNALWSGGGIIILAIAIVMQRNYVRWMEQFKSRLIRIGDRIEFAKEEEGGYVQQFESARVLRKMRGEDVAISGFFLDEMVPFYSHFYLVELDDKNAIIPYEWILSIELEDELPAV